MAFINYATKSLAIKIVYYGPGLSGKTTNIRYIYSKMDPDSRGELICLETPIERTIFFDLLPIKAGLINGFDTHFQLMTVPGQVFYEASRKSVVKGVDGIVFVADSQVPLIDANLENFDNLRRNLLDHDIDLNLIPLVFQYNKRDLENLVPVETFNSLLNPKGRPYVESAAINGDGVLETLKEIAKVTVPWVREKLFGEKRDSEDKEDQLRMIKEAEANRGKVKTEIEFVPEEEAAPIRMTKIKFKSQTDIEDQLESLAKEFTFKK
jgi:signal recognition particle receptor subunit beta